MAIPTISGGIFNFTEEGYSPPTFSGGVYNLGEGELARFDLGAMITGFTVKDLGAYIKSAVQASKNLGAYIRPFHYENLRTTIRGIGKGTENLEATLTGELFKSTADLQAVLNAIKSVNLGAYICGVYGPYDLRAALNVISIENLPAVLKVLLAGIKNLQAYVNVIEVGNLPADIHGWDTRDLGAFATGVYGPYDLQAYLRVYPYKDLSAAIHGWYSGIEDLQGIIEGWHSFNLGASISLKYPADLGAYIFADGAANLAASIIPRVIYLKQAIRVALLEHLDLSAMINSSCFASASVNLSAYIYPLMKSDLRAIIFGWEQEGIYSNIVNLVACINAGTVVVEDKLPIRFVPQPLKYTILRIKFGKKPSYTVFDTLRILFSSYPAANLSATITGVLESANLSAYIKAVFDWNYSELPPYVNPKTHEVVIDFNEDGYENWRRFVEIFFDFTGDSPYHYFYVSGPNKVYRVNRDRHWVIRSKSYQRVSGMIERRSVRRKYIFKMSDYANVDEAVRDLIDRVSTYRRSDLGAYINAGVFCPHLDLSASIYPDVKYSWVKHLHASVVGRLRFYKGTESFDLSASINVP